MAGKVEQLILDLWTRTRMDWGFATSRIAETFRSERSLGSSERRQVAETLYGMIRQARRVDFALERAGLRRVASSRRERARYLAYRVLEGDLPVATAQQEEPAVDWAVVSGIDAVISREKDPVRRLGLARSMPDWLAARLLEEYGADSDADADALCAALNERAPLTVRANTLVTTREDLAQRLKAEGIETRPTRWAAAGLELVTRVNAFGLAAFREGQLEVQDEASQLVAELVSPPRGLVIDACAGAGGKSLALGALMRNRGRLVALDVSGRKLAELRRRARRARLSNLRAIEIGGGPWPEEVAALRGKADRVLVDAPCSGIGALRRNPEARWRLGEEHIGRLPAEQEAIVREALRLLAPGGLLVYATCTVLRSENEGLVARLLYAGLGLEVVPQTQWPELASPDGRFLKLLPHVHGTDGFFAAVLRRT